MMYLLAFDLYLIYLSVLDFLCLLVPGHGATWKSSR